MTIKTLENPSRRQFLAGTAAAGALALLHPFSAFASGNQAHLRLMETTDLHVHVFPYDYYGDRPSDAVGLSRTATLIRGFRDEATNSLLVDNGDFLQGNPMGDYIAYERGMKDGNMHPIIQAMNTLDFDASTLGNHEFNYGLDFLMKTLNGAEFPVVSANVAKGALATNPRDDTLFLKPYVIIDRTIKDSNWSFSPVEGATAIFETGPKARAFMNDVRDVTIEDAGEGAEGFAKYRIKM